MIPFVSANLATIKAEATKTIGVTSRIQTRVHDTEDKKGFLDRLGMLLRTLAIAAIVIGVLIFLAWSGVLTWLRAIILRFVSPSTTSVMTMLAKQLPPEQVTAAARADPALNKMYKTAQKRNQQGTLVWNDSSKTVSSPSSSPSSSSSASSASPSPPSSSATSSARV